MKTIIRLALVAMIVLGSQSSYASKPYPGVTIRVLDMTSFALYIDQIEDQNLKLSIKDKSGNSLYSKSIRSKRSYARKINLKNLPKGAYALEIRDNISTLSYPIVLVEGSLHVRYDQKVETFNPIVKQKPNRLDLALFSPEMHKHQLNIYNDDNELIHEETIEETVNYRKQFDFSKAIPGSYRVVVNSHGHEYRYSVPVK